MNPWGVYNAHLHYLIPHHTDTELIIIVSISHHGESPLLPSEPSKTIQDACEYSASVFSLFYMLPFPLSCYTIILNTAELYFTCIHFMISSTYFTHVYIHTATEEHIYSTMYNLLCIQ